MALQRALTHQRLFPITKISSSSTLNLTLIRNLSPFSSPFLETLVPPDPSRTTFSREFISVPDSGKKGFFRRFLQKRTIFQSEMSPELRSLPIGEKLMEKLKGMNINRDRLRLEELNPPPIKQSETSFNGISVEDAKKLLRLSQLEMLKSTLRRIPKNSISYTEFIEICVEATSPSQGSSFAKTLDESGAVIVLGNVVFLRPEQVAKAIESVIPLPIAHPNDPRKKELEKMEKEKEAIDEKAGVLVKRELWGGLGLLVLQTAGFMRLTFWELSWDVMEPICFFVTSIYFMAGYAFFLRTSRDPSFEGFFQSRFSSKQKRLMKNHKFDIKRFDELKKAYYPASAYSSEPSVVANSSFDHSDRTTLICALHH
ncbi:Coiled-coil domain containing protein 109 [Macleaya cordata]|uniref:Coiled-coil domain containing protein 109 n=1 Tax=Macleaya cordata TaxID=56857 RepID=A0A200R7F1_MACCD|nr:Coiled-coil domain containing protein 109 [Macleaya cordata]